jgi:hypothetical protein
MDPRLLRQLQMRSGQEQKKNKNFLKQLRDFVMDARDFGGQAVSTLGAINGLTSQHGMSEYAAPFRM